MDPEQPKVADLVSIPPRVSRVIVCDHAEYNTEDSRWVLTGPWSVRFANPNEEESTGFPVLLPDLWVYLELTGGLSDVRFGIEVRRKFDLLASPNPETDFQVHVGEPIWSGVSDDPYHFPPGETRLRVYEIVCRLQELQLPNEGAYEFRVITSGLDPVTGGLTGHVPLDGQTGEVILLDPTRSM